MTENPIYLLFIPLRSSLFFFFSPYIMLSLRVDFGYRPGSFLHFSQNPLFGQLIPIYDLNTVYRRALMLAHLMISRLL